MHCPLSYQAILNASIPIHYFFIVPLRIGKAVIWFSSVTNVLQDEYLYICSVYFIKKSWNYLLYKSNLHDRGRQQTYIVPWLMLFLAVCEGGKWTAVKMLTFFKPLYSGKLPLIKSSHAVPGSWHPKRWPPHTFLTDVDRRPAKTFFTVIIFFYSVRQVSRICIGKRRWQRHKLWRLQEANKCTFGHACRKCLRRETMGLRGVLACDRINFESIIRINKHPLLSVWLHSKGCRSG